jgi:hypothetical protein
LPVASYRYANGVPAIVARGQAVRRRSRGILAFQFEHARVRSGWPGGMRELTKVPDAVVNVALLVRPRRCSVLRLCMGATALVYRIRGLKR